MSTPAVYAAGAVVLREHRGKTEVLVVHRPRYDDWSLPKGKLDKGETDAACAVREVAEETGVIVRLTAPLTARHYPVKAGLKQVDWWLAEAIDGTAGSITDTDEVDEVAWLPLHKAAKLLSYADERVVLAEAAALPPVTPLLIVRHAKALPRKHWSTTDTERPITKWGQRQARSLVPFLDAFGVRRVVSSSALRCVQTVQPAARALDLPLEGWDELTEETFRQDPDPARLVSAVLAAEVGRTGVPTVVCGHRPVLPTMTEGVGVPIKKFATAQALVVALRKDGTPVAYRCVVQRLD